MLSTADRSLLYDKSSPYKWLLELVCDPTSAAGGQLFVPTRDAEFRIFVVISLVAIPPTSAEAPDPADRFRFHFPVSKELKSDLIFSHMRMHLILVLHIAALRKNS